MATTLVVNLGSSSKKYALYCGGKQALSVKFEKTSSGFEVCASQTGEMQKKEQATMAEFNNSLKSVQATVDKYVFREGVSQISKIVIRVVAPGTAFQKHSVIDDEYIALLKSKIKSAPIHIPIVLREIGEIKETYPEIKIIAASDSEFHKTIPSHARIYSIDSRDAEELDLYRFGYHGLSISSINGRVHSLVGIDPEKMIVCHIGSGVSVTSLKNGVSVETTMGFTPTSGLPMSSRAGDLDSTALLHLMNERNWKPQEAELYLDTRGGLVGIAGEADIRKLLDRKVQKDEKAELALNKFAYSIKKAIASGTVSLEGLDVLVLTATAAVRSIELRSLVLSGLEHLGIKISEDRNNLMVGKDGIISVQNSPVKVVVMRTDEMGEMSSIATQFD